ncbi:MAG: hypothetical protein IT270_17685 [Saprospiraceae bacterium]|nr:hypothetical protein [Saprospiraceae bacterium]
MFDRIYAYRKADKQRGVTGETVHLFVFRTTKRRCIIFEAHEFSTCPLMVVKFFDKAHKLSDKRFSLLNGSNEAGSIIRTALEIMLELYKSNPFLSFAFMGAPDEDGDLRETRRFRIYREMLKRLFSDLDFQHIQQKEKSLYVLLNRNYCGTQPERQNDIFSTLANHYPEAKPE